jgi:hypothetical protein
VIYITLTNAEWNKMAAGEEEIVALSREYGFFLSYIVI